MIAARIFLLLILGIGKDAAREDFSERARGARLGRTIKKSPENFGERAEQRERGKIAVEEIIGREGSKKP